MAASPDSPAIIKGGSETAVAAASTPSPGTSAGGVKSSGIQAVMMQHSETVKDSRGRNKPRCSQCGNVARSRCPFQCCKSCCAKAQNPCHIHVLKPNTTIADRGASANSTITEQQPSEVTPSVPPAKVTPLRPISSTFAQFNNLHMPLRSRKPLTRKDALVINEWRFAKLKENKESSIEAENEAFDRYMQNISLLEEVFEVNERPDQCSSQMSNLSPSSSEKMDMVSEMKAKLRSNPVRIDAFRKKIRLAVDDGLRKLQVYASNDNSGDPSNEGDITTKARSWWSGKTSALMELNDKLNKARSEEDLKLCMELRSKIKGQPKFTSQRKPESSEISKEQISLNDLGAVQESENSLVKFVRTTKIDQDALTGMDSHFSSLEEIEDL